MVTLAEVFLLSGARPSGLRSSLPFASGSAAETN